MWGESALWFDGGEVVDVVADEAAQVLHVAVDQFGEVQRVPSRPPVVIRGRVDRGPVRLHAPVGVQGEGDEQGRAEGLAVRGGVDLADRPGRDRTTWQVWDVLATSGGPLRTVRDVRGDLADDTGSGEFAVDLPQQLPQFRGILTCCFGFLRLGLDLGALFHPEALFFVRVCADDDWLFLQVPALPALRRPDLALPLRARRTHRRQGVPARQVHDLALTGG